MSSGIGMPYDVLRGERLTPHTSNLLDNFPVHTVRLNMTSHCKFVECTRRYLHFTVVTCMHFYYLRLTGAYVNCVLRLAPECTVHSCVMRGIFVCV